MLQELAFYPTVALVYFFGVLRGTQENRIDFPPSASVNVFCLFVLVQPLCLIIGSHTGMLTYALTALISYYCMAWKEPDDAGKDAGNKDAGKKDTGQKDTGKKDTGKKKKSN